MLRSKGQALTLTLTLALAFFFVTRRWCGREEAEHKAAMTAAIARQHSAHVSGDDWGTQRPAIMKKNNWPTCPSEVLISTPRRFGKVRPPCRVADLLPELPQLRIHDELVPFSIQ